MSFCLSDIQTISTELFQTLSSSGNQNNEPALIKFDDEPATLSTGVQNLRSYMHDECISSNISIHLSGMNPVSFDSTTKNTQQQST